jgi:hypothetical protein
MEAIGSLLLVIGVLVLFTVLLAVVGLASLTLRWIVRVWSGDPSDPWP